MAERIKQNELLYRLSRQDPDSLVLFVEGFGDLRFWSLMVPISQRVRASVYPIQIVEIEGGAEGERGRALQLAEALWETDVRDRVLFFIDADYDRLLGRQHRPNVVLTDYRDLEAYAYELDALTALLFSMGEDPGAAGQLAAICDAVLRPCGTLRLADATHRHRLPFQQTWGDRLRRHIRGPRNNPHIDVDQAIRVLLQNRGEGPADAPTIRAQYDAVAQQLCGAPSRDFVHGKDLINVIAWRFQTTLEEAERALLGALAASLDRIRTLPNITAIEAFVRS